MTVIFFSPSNGTAFIESIAHLELRATVRAVFDEIGDTFKWSPAAVAMQPPAPTVYRQFLGGAIARMQVFSQLTTMALRHITRHPVRSSLTSFGISFAVALMAMGLGTMDSVDYMIDAIFFQTNRQDATLMFGASDSAKRFVALG